MSRHECVMSGYMSRHECLGVYIYIYIYMLRHECLGVDMCDDMNVS